MTAMGREFELKYRADSGVIAAIRAAFGDFSEIRMETVYYDTLDAALSRRRWMLRRRYENGTSVCTLKTPLPDGSRGEWETPCDDIRLAARGFVFAMISLFPYRNFPNTKLAITSMMAPPILEEICA